jgi:hypothetical protein
MREAMRSGVAVVCAAATVAAMVGAASAQPAAPGSSMANAIMLPGVQNEQDGVAAEYAYIREHFSGCRPTQQALLRDGARSYDAIKLAGPGCGTPAVFFDVTDWIGK